jgi:hypothetical protein
MFTGAHAARIGCVSVHFSRRSYLMIGYTRAAKVLVCLAVLVVGCRTVANPDPAPGTCGTNDPRVGSTAELTTLMHGVRGTAKIVSNCKIVIEHFYYDGISLDTRVVGVQGEDYWNCVVLTADIGKAGGYQDVTLEVPLPDGVTLDDIPRIAITCVRVGAPFAVGDWYPPTAP